MFIISDPNKLSSLILLKNLIIIYMTNIMNGYIYLRLSIKFLEQRLSMILVM